MAGKRPILPGMHWEIVANHDGSLWHDEVVDSVSVVAIAVLEAILGTAS
jgi:hypothetical protein